MVTPFLSEEPLSEPFGLTLRVALASDAGPPEIVMDPTLNRSYRQTRHSTCRRLPLRFEGGHSRELDRPPPPSCSPEIDLSCLPMLPPVAPCAKAALIGKYNSAAANPSLRTIRMHTPMCCEQIIHQ